MANFYGSCRTNYFNVKDEAAFEEEMANIPDIEVLKEANGYVILGDDPNGGTWPSWIYDEENGDEHEIDLMDIVAKHLIDGEVAIFMECGAEKLRYIVGNAVAVNNKGEYRTVNINDIYTLAQDLTDRPGDITPAEY